MSKRFGRQQKRKMREEISSLKKNVERRDSLAALNEKAVQDCVDVLGHRFVGLPVMEIDVPDCGDKFRVAAMNERLGRPVFSIDEYERAKDLRFCIHELGLLKSEVIRDDLRDHLHIRVRHPELNEVAYAISRRTLELMPPDLLIARISEELSLSIAHQFVKQGVTR